MTTHAIPELERRPHPLAHVDDGDPTLAGLCLAISQARTAPDLSAFVYGDDPAARAFVHRDSRRQFALPFLVARHARRMDVRLLRLLLQDGPWTTQALLENAVLSASQRDAAAAYIATLVTDPSRAWEGVAAAQWWYAHQPVVAGRHLSPPLVTAAVWLAEHGMARALLFQFFTDTPALPPALIRRVIAGTMRVRSRPPGADPSSSIGLVSCRQLLVHPAATVEDWRAAAACPGWGFYAIVLAHHAPARALPDLWAQLRAERGNPGVLAALLVDAPPAMVPGLLADLLQTTDDDVATRICTEAFARRTDLSPDHLAPLFTVRDLRQHEQYLALLGRMRFVASSSDLAPAHAAGPCASPLCPGASAGHQ